MVTRTFSDDLGHLRPCIRAKASHKKMLVRLLSFAVLVAIATLPCDAKSSVSLDLLNPDRSQDHLLRPYMLDLRQRVQSNWRLSKKSERTTKVYFEIGPSGELATAKVQTSSGDGAVDKCSVRAISECSPFRMPPRTANGNLNILATFRNNLQPVVPGAVHPDFVVRVEHGAFENHKFKADPVRSHNDHSGSGDEWEHERSPFASSPADIYHRTSSAPVEAHSDVSASRVRTLASAIPIQTSKVASHGSASSSSAGRWNSTYKRKLEPWEEELLRSRSELPQPNVTQPTHATSQSLPPKTAPQSLPQVKKESRADTVKIKTIKKTSGYMPSVSKPAPSASAPQRDSLPPITPNQATNLMRTPPRQNHATADSMRAPQKNSDETPQSDASEEVSPSGVETRAGKFSVGSENENFPWWLLVLGGVAAATIYGIVASGKQTCPFCAEVIKKAAIVCKHCNSKLKEPVNEMTSS